MSNKILLHACCGICSGYPIHLLTTMGYEPIIYFCNPNLDSEIEYARRLKAQETVCNYYTKDLIAEPYNHDIFLKTVTGLESEPEKGLRCDKCIKLRLEMTAAKSMELGIDKFTTSLVISPHKNFNKITSIGEACAKKFNNLEYIAIDFKKKDGFLKTNLLSKQLELYRQNYCGCEFSMN